MLYPIQYYHVAAIQSYRGFGVLGVPPGSDLPVRRPVLQAGRAARPARR